MCGVCVFSSHFILDVKFVGSISRGHTGFLIHLPSAVLALIFLARRYQPFLFIVDHEVDFLCNDLIVLHLLGIFVFIFIILVRKNSSYRDSNSTSQRVRRLRGYQMSYREKNERNITIEKRRGRKKKHLTVVDPDALFMRNSKLIYCPQDMHCVINSRLRELRID